MEGMELEKEGMEMEKEGSKEDMGINYVSIEPANNGWVINFSEKRERPGSGLYESANYIDTKLVFKMDQTDEAFEKFKKLKVCESKTKMDRD